MGPTCAFAFTMALALHTTAGRLGASLPIARKLQSRLDTERKIDEFEGIVNGKQLPLAFGPSK